MKVKDLITENIEDSFPYFKKQIEAIVGSELTKKEMRDAFYEWEQGGVSPEEMASWIKSDRAEAQSTFPDDDYTSVDDETDDMDYTEYSMRQGEMGNPGWRR